MILVGQRVGKVWIEDLSKINPKVGYLTASTSKHYLHNAFENIFYVFSIFQLDAERPVIAIWAHIILLSLFILIYFNHNSRIAIFGRKQFVESPILFFLSDSIRLRVDAFRWFLSSPAKDFTRLIDLAGWPLWRSERFSFPASQHRQAPSNQLSRKV